jgi:hypothetical protein
MFRMDHEPSVLAPAPVRCTVAVLRLPDVQTFPEPGFVQAWP